MRRFLFFLILGGSLLAARSDANIILAPSGGPPPSIAFVTSATPADGNGPSLTSSVTLTSATHTLLVVGFDPVQDPVRMTWFRGHYGVKIGRAHV